jgi:hypothetical protein
MEVIDKITGDANLDSVLQKLPAATAFAKKPKFWPLSISRNSLVEMA